MTEVSLTPLEDESGYMGTTGGVQTAYFPEALATCGFGAAAKVEFRGWISFDMTGLPNGTVLRAATLVIDTVTTVGGPRVTWETNFSAVDLDLTDLPTSWADDKGTVAVVNEESPTSFSVNFDALVAVLFNADHSRVAFKLTEVIPLAEAYVLPVVASAHLELTYSSGQAEVTLTSGLATEVAFDCALGSATSGESGIVAEFEADSGVATDTALESGIGSTVELESGVDLEE